MQRCFMLISEKYDQHQLDSVIIGRLHEPECPPGRPEKTGHILVRTLIQAQIGISGNFYSTIAFNSASRASE